MLIMAIDPGPEQSGWIVYDSTAHRVLDKGIKENLDIRNMLITYGASILVVIEQVEHFGMPVGKSVFETVRWTGRFEEEVFNRGSTNVVFMPRRQVKLHLCNSMRAKDPNIRQALIDRFGGKEKAIGKKKTQGPLWGIKSHLWSALALAVTYAEINNSK